MFAILNWRAHLPAPALTRRRSACRRWALAALACVALAGFNLALGAGPPAPGPAELAARAEERLAAARQRHLAEPTNSVAAWTFAQACFDRAEFSTNQAERAMLAAQGIAACRDLLAREAGCAPAHYYLGMNLGQLARTKTLGAFKVVDEMEREFKAAAALDERLDYAGPDRNLGLLYREAPRIGSVGSRSNARQHLRRAVELAPDYPENRLNLLEAYVKWNDRVSARAELKALEAIWPVARAKFAGEVWVPSWADWEARLQRAKQKIEERLESPRGSP